MRFREFNLKLYEFAPPASNDKVSQLVGILQDPQEESSLKQKVISLLQTMLQDLHQSNTPPEDVVAEDLASGIINQAISSKEDLLKLLNSPEYAAYFKEIMAEKETEVRSLVKSERKQGETQVNDIVKSIIKKKFQVGGDKAETAIISVVEGLLRSEKVGFNEMIKFLQDCDAGTIDTSSMISPKGKEGIIPISNPSYKTLIQHFLNIAEVKVGNATWGRGEIGLAFCGINTIKAVSDISVGKDHIEVKAGSANVDFFMKGQKGFKTQMPALEQLIDALNHVALRKGLPTFEKTNKARQGGISALGDRRIQQLNKYFVHMGKPEVENLLLKILVQIHKAEPSIVNKYAQAVKNAVNDNGAVDYTALSIATAQLSFEYYETMEQHDGVLMLNIPNFTFIYTSKGSSSSFGKLVANNKIKPTNAIDFRSNSDGGLSYFIN